jgi:hypothetical protein
MHDFWNALNIATAKAIPTLGVALLTLILGWVVGTGITSRWESVKKRRALELEALANFYCLYGEFFAVWKLWSVRKKNASHLVGHERDPKAEWDILRRAADVEGGLESIMVRLTQERTLSKQQLRDLACFREAYQCLREAIRSDVELRWWNQPHRDEGFAQYCAFKRLASTVASLLSAESHRLFRKPVAPTAADAMQNLAESTDSAQFRTSWWKDHASKNPAA